MIKLTSDNIEFRGIKNCVSKKDNTYYILNCENTIDGSPIAFYVRDASLIPTGLRKGDKIRVVVVYNRFKELEIKDVVKV